MSNPATASFPVALTVGVAYVFGMVAPMVALALAWDRRDWGVLLTGRSVTWRIGRLSRTLPLGYALSGGLLVLMGALTVALAPRGPGMANDGWQVQVSAALQHAAAVTTRFLSGVPGWVTALLIFGALAGFLRAAPCRSSATQAVIVPTSSPTRDEKELMPR